jgi:hypothetical protein
MKTLAALRTKAGFWLWKHTPTCREMSRLASRSFEQAPSFRVRIEMMVHYALCVWCKRYAEHLKFLRRAAPALPQAGSAAHHKLPEESRRRITARLREAVET